MRQQRDMPPRVPPASHREQLPVLRRADGVGKLIPLAVVAGQEAFGWLVGLGLLVHDAVGKLITLCGCMDCMA